MREHHVGCVVVVDQAGKPIGMLTDRDIVVRALAQTDRHLEQIRVDDIMAQPVVTAAANADLVEAMTMMRSAGIHRLPIVNAGGNLVGLLSFDDLIEYFQGRLGDLASLLQQGREHEQLQLTRPESRSTELENGVSRTARIE